jgi:hypothetical protein
VAAHVNHHVAPPCVFLNRASAQLEDMMLFCVSCAALWRAAALQFCVLELEGASLIVLLACYVVSCSGFCTCLSSCQGFQLCHITS